MVRHWNSRLVHVFNFYPLLHTPLTAHRHQAVAAYIASGANKCAILSLLSTQAGDPRLRQNKRLEAGQTFDPPKKKRFSMR